MRLRDVRQVDVANQLLLFMVLLMVLQWARHAVAVLEHPELPEVKCGVQPPSIWLLPVFKILMALKGIHVLHIAQGFWGARSPKPTALMVIARDVDKSNLYASLNRTRTRTTLPQALHMGKTGDGKAYNTAALKRYPPALCEGISLMLFDLTNKVSQPRADADEFSSTFDCFAHAYQQSSEKQDGQDYVPHDQKPQHKLGASNPP